MALKLMPEKLEMRANAFIDGAHGMAAQVYVSEEYGVSVTSSRAKHGAPWVQVWIAECLPGREFSSMKALREAYNATAQTAKGGDK